MTLTHKYTNTSLTDKASIIIFVLALLFIAAFFLLSVILGWPFTPDSGAYLEMARNLAAGRGFLVANLGEGCNQWKSVSLFPGGLSVLLALPTAIGLNPATAGVILMGVLWTLLPLATAWAFLNLLGRNWALLLAAWTALSPGVAWMGSHVLSDLPFLLAAIIGFGFWSRGYNSGLKWNIAAGVALGISMWLRNAGVALVFSYAITMVFELFSGRINLRTYLRRWVPFWIASAIVYGPWLVRNLVVFGELQPYDMAPSTVSWADNLRTLIQEFGAEWMGNRAGRYIAWSLPIAGGAAAFLGITILAAAYKWRHDQPKDTTKSCLVWLLSYTISGMILLVIARSTYEWGELINHRHLGQHLWAAGALMIWSFSDYKRFMPFLIGLPLILSLGFRIYNLIHISYETLTARTAAATSGLLDLESIPITPALRRAQLRKLAYEELEDIGISIIESEATNPIIITNDPNVILVKGNLEVRASFVNMEILSTCGRPILLARLCSKPWPKVESNNETNNLYHGACLTLYALKQ